MELAIKDILIMCGTAISVGGVWARNEFKNSTNTKDIKKLSDFFKKVVLDDNGQIRLIDTITCKEKRSEIQKNINYSRKEIKNISTKQDTMNENLLLIIYHLNIDPENKKIKKGL